jgi:hypothetical protein
MRAVTIKEAKARLNELVEAATRLGGSYRTGLRIVFTLDREACSFVRAGTHDEVRRYLRSL